MTRRTRKPEPSTAWHPGALREIARIELVPEAVTACDALFAGLEQLVARRLAAPSDELRAVAHDLVAVAGWLRTVEKHARSSTLDLCEQGMARVAASGAQELDRWAQALREAAGPPARAPRGEAGLRETHLVGLSDGAWRGGLEWMIEELRTASLEEGRVTYEPTMVAAYCGAAGRELRYLASRLLDVSAETRETAELAHGAGRTCSALAEQLDAALSEPVAARG